MTDPVTTGPLVILMDAAEARQYTDWINQSLNEANAYLLEIYEREGWRALGYPSFEAWGHAEIHIGRRQLYRLLKAETVEQEVLALPEVTTEVRDRSSVPGDTLSEPKEVAPARPWVRPNERQTRELQELLIQQGPQAVHELWGEIQDEYGPTASAAYVRAKVEERLGARVPKRRQAVKKDAAPVSAWALTADRPADAAVLRQRWAYIMRSFEREWSVVNPVELARALADTELTPAAERLVHMAEWLVQMNGIVEERRGRTVT